MSYLEALSRTILLCRDYVDEGQTDQDIALSFRSLRVRCVADEMNISCHAGQTAVITLISLLSRMGMQVDLVMPDCRILNPQAPFAAGGIRSALIDSSERLVPGAAVTAAAFVPDLVFAIGSTKIDCEDIPGWHLFGTAWSGSIAMPGSEQPPAWAAEFPVGGMVSALLAANEAFKAAIRRLRIRDQSGAPFFELCSRCVWDFGEVMLPTKSVDVGSVDVISAGAITQAALYALLRIPRIQMRGRVLDDDETGLSNLNRNMLTVLEDVGRSKVEILSVRCAPNIELEAIPKRFGSTFESRLPLASRVLVGVDDIPSRWAVQQHAPGWLGVGGTSHFSISSSSHRKGEPCSGCLHPIDDTVGPTVIPTVSFVSFWSGLALAVRLIREAVGSPYLADRQHLWLTPLRMDLCHAGMWSPVHARNDCPVGCSASKLVNRPAA